jgi:hypothetical protein
MGTDTPPLAELPLISLRAKRLPFLVNIFSLVVVRLQQSSELNWGHIGLKNYSS